MCKTVTSLCLTIALTAGLQAGAAERPMNVLFLMVDDLNTWLLGDADR